MVLAVAILLHWRGSSIGFKKKSKSAEVKLELLISLFFRGKPTIVSELKTIHICRSAFCFNSKRKKRGGWVGFEPDYLLRFFPTYRVIPWVYPYLSHNENKNKAHGDHFCWWYVPMQGTAEKQKTPELIRNVS